MKKKKVYEEPEIVFFDAKTGELSGTPKMVQIFRNYLDKNAEEVKRFNCILQNDYDM